MLKLQRNLHMVEFNLHHPRSVISFQYCIYLKKIVNQRIVQSKSDEFWRRIEAEKLVFNFESELILD